MEQSQFPPSEPTEVGAEIGFSIDGLPPETVDRSSLDTTQAPATGMRQIVLAHTLSHYFAGIPLVPGLVTKFRDGDFTKLSVALAKPHEENGSSLDNLTVELSTQIRILGLQDVFGSALLLGVLQPEAVGRFQTNVTQNPSQSFLFETRPQGDSHSDTVIHTHLVKSLWGTEERRQTVVTELRLVAELRVRTEDDKKRFAEGDTAYTPCTRCEEDFGLGLHPAHDPEVFLPVPTGPAAGPTEAETCESGRNNTEAGHAAPFLGSQPWSPAFMTLDPRHLNTNESAFGPTEIGSLEPNTALDPQNLFHLPAQANPPQQRAVDPFARGPASFGQGDASVRFPPERRFSMPLLGGTAPTSGWRSTLSPIPGSPSPSIVPTLSVAHDPPSQPAVGRRSSTFASMAHIAPHGASARTSTASGRLPARRPQSLRGSGPASSRQLRALAPRLPADPPHAPLSHAANGSSSLAGGLFQGLGPLMSQESRQGVLHTSGEHGSQAEGQLTGSQSLQDVPADTRRSAIENKDGTTEGEDLIGDPPSASQ